MTAPSYTTDLTTITLCNVAGGTTNWTALGAGNSGLAADTDYFIEGDACISRAFNATGLRGLIYNAGTGLTITSPNVFMMWFKFAGEQNLEIEANGGIRYCIGSSTTAYNEWYVKGKDTYTYGGWLCIPVDPSETTDNTEGTPSGTLQYFGARANTTASITKGNVFGFDALRYGRGQLISEFGEAADYATFAGAATVNDGSSARWGLFQETGGSYLMQGLFQLGSATNLVDFRDSNRIIFIANTKKVAVTFNTIEVLNASSNIEWTNISITALGTVSRGRFLVTDNATVAISNCTFSNLNTFTFQSNSTINTTIFRKCGLITQGAAVFAGCRIEESINSIAMAVDTIASVTDTIFVSDGTGYAIEGFSSAGDYTLTDLTFTGYATSDGSTGNEAIHVLADSGIVNLNITGGNTPSIHTAGATVNVIAGSVTVQVTVKTVSGSPIENARVLVIAEAGGGLPSNVTVTISNSGTTATVTHTGHAMATNDKVQIKGASHVENNGVFSITKINNDSYSYTMGSAPGSNPTGVIKATYAVLSDLTNASGIVSMSRVFPSDQPFSGKARKSTSAPYYKTTTFSDTIDSTLNFSTNIQLIEDQ